MRELNDEHQNHASKFLQNFMNQNDLQFKNNTNTTKYNTLLDYIWTNAPGNVSKISTTKAYWLDYHKPIYFAFKLPNHISRYTKKTYNYNFI